MAPNHRTHVRLLTLYLSTRRYASDLVTGVAPLCDDAIISNALTKEIISAGVGSSVSDEPTRGV